MPRVRRQCRPQHQAAPYSPRASLQQDIAEQRRRRHRPCQQCACLATMARPSSPAAPRDPRRASVVLSRFDSLCTLCQAGAAVSSRSCHICATSGLESPLLQGLGEVDRQHLPPLSISHAVFSRDENPVLPGEPRAARTMAEPEACVTYTLQRIRLRVLSGLGEPPAALRDAEPRGDAFAPLETAQGSIPAIDRSPVPPIETSWALYEGNDLGLR